MAKKAHTKPAVKDGSRFEGWPPFDRPPEPSLAAKLAGLSRLAQELDEQSAGIKEPRGGWRTGFVALLVRGRCPWCDAPIQMPSVGGVGLHQDRRQGALTWSCPEGCNP
jgi:hypothetical protein